MKVSMYLQLGLDEDSWRLKIAALLHDPITKPLVITKKNNKKHEIVARDIAIELQVAGIRIEKENIGLGWLIANHHNNRMAEEYASLKALIEADQNSSAADRVSVKGDTRDILLIHPLSGEKLTELNIVGIDYSRVNEIVVENF